MTDILSLDVLSVGSSPARASPSLPVLFVLVFVFGGGGGGGGGHTSPPSSSPMAHTASSSRLLSRAAGRARAPAGSEQDANCH